MDTREKIDRILKERVLILDGAFGTELYKKGMPSGVCPEKWCIENPHVLKEVHSNYVKAGSDIFFTCTFGANPFKLAEFGITNTIEINKQLVQIAKEASNGQALIAGDISCSGRFIEPFGDLTFEEAVKGFKVQVKALYEAGVDLFVIETMIDIQEARAALIAVKEICSLYTMVTMTFEKSGKTLNGTDPQTAIITLQSLGADAVGCNCSLGPKEMAGFIRQMNQAAKVPIIAKPNAGLPQLKDGKTFFTMGDQEFASFAGSLIEAGAAMVGGCCGTSPAFIKALSTTLKTTKPALDTDALAGVSSVRQSILFNDQAPVLVIGERINPTGKIKLQKALKENDYSYIKGLASEQFKKGADLLDVNAGMPGIDEKAALCQIICALCISSPLPLVIDSTNIDCIEAALRLYPGRALVNSISGESVKLDKLFPIAKKYGAMLVCLPLTDQGVPATAEERIEIVQRIIAIGKKFGFTNDDYVVDGLVLTASSNRHAALETMKTIRLASKMMGLKTVIGLSNVSFGLPERKWINTAFLAMAINNGLSMTIANPDSEEIMAIKKASDLLSGYDPDARNYISHFSANPQTRVTKPEEQKVNPMQAVSQSVMDGLKDSISGWITKSLETGVKPDILISDYMIPAITEVGTLYEKKVYFLPQLIASAETMQTGFKILEPLLAEKTKTSRGTIVAATVEGDIHDIGKNIVILMLKNSGFNVIDLGKDVAGKVIVEQAAANKASLILLSALMTTTMVKMKEVIQLAKSQAVNAPVMVGGAVVTKEYADSIGGYYSKDSIGAVKLALELVRS